ncbi:hypothetical protein [Bacillus salipaludis]|uniref:Uncharacterized protein n=1 Tax=Bacillus salipaludis TaxID=2547811 RepID=A0ABW8RDR1_9BACI
MGKFIKISLIVLGVIAVGIGILIFTFVQGMKPDKDQEEKVRMQAEKYLAEIFNENFEIYDTLYDNMGNFEFEYAAKVMDKQTHTQFLIYYDDEAEQMVDTYVADKWENDLESEIRPYIKENFGEKADFYVYFDDKIGRDLGIDPAQSGSYKEFNVTPTIRITLPRKKSDGDEILFNEFISILKNEGKPQHGSVNVAYIAENGVILEDHEWSKKF